MKTKVTILEHNRLRS